MNTSVYDDSVNFYDSVSNFNRGHISNIGFDFLKT